MNQLAASPAPQPPNRPLTDAELDALVRDLQALYDGATAKRSKRWWRGGFGWLRPGVSSKDAVTLEAEDFIVGAHNRMPALLAALAALRAERDVLREREARVRAALASEVQFLEECAEDASGMCDYDFIGGMSNVIRAMTAALDAPVSAADDETEARDAL